MNRRDAILGTAVLVAGASRGRAKPIRPVPRAGTARFPAAVKAGAQVIARANLEDFGDLLAGIDAQSPDVFLCNRFDLDPDGFVELLGEPAAHLVHPPMTFDELLQRRVRVVPDLVAAVREQVDES